MQEQQKTYFHKYLHKWLRDTGEPRSVLWTKLNIHESTLSKWLSATRIPSAGAIKFAVNILNPKPPKPPKEAKQSEVDSWHKQCERVEKQRSDDLWFIYYGGK